MPCIDIHTHYAPDEDGNLFIKNISPSDIAINLQPGGFYSVGLHPWFIGNNHNHKDQLLELDHKVELPEVIAVGECGLDKLANTETQLQLEIFIHHLELAEKANKPLVIHCVKAYNEISHLKRKMKPKVPWILHGYSGNEFITKQLLLLDFYFSLGKIIFDEQAQVRKALPLIPADHVFFETDEWKQPVDLVYKEFARLKGISLEDLSEQVMWNFRQVFIR